MIGLEQENVSTRLQKDRLGLKSKRQLDFGAIDLSPLVEFAKQTSLTPPCFRIGLNLRRVGFAKSQEMHAVGLFVSE